MSDELERLRNIIATGVSGVCSEYHDSDTCCLAVVADFETAVRRDERASMPCYRYYPFHEGKLATCITDGAGKPYQNDDPCPSCAERLERKRGT